MAALLEDPPPSLVTLLSSWSRALQSIRIARRVPAPGTTQERPSGGGKASRRASGTPASQRSTPTPNVPGVGLVFSPWIQSQCVVQ